ncbi:MULTISPECIES: DUF6069 family protein [unclassified Kribbella]|uniref:DUF6069 family protein n=1 Tax=unclassified Kribbella TaxID=2644121 RepID=UPI00301B312B
MSATAVAPVRTRRTSRAVAAGLAAVGALLVWLVADPLLGVDFEVTRSGTTTVVGPGMVVFMALGAGLVGWAFLALLERFTERARRVWVITASVVLLLSLVMPFNSGEIATDAKVSLLLMHVVVGAVLIPLYARTAGGRSKKDSSTTT